MTQGEQIDALALDLSKVIDRYRDEFEITLAGVIGVLEILKLDLYTEAANADD